MTDPNVVYDFVQNQITVDVVVEDQIVAGLPVIRPGQWTVTWNLQTSLTPPPIFCSEHGIKISHEKPAELHHDEPQSVSDSSWSVVFVNNCVSANAVNYDINLQPGHPDSQALKDRTTTNLEYHHDPTISVVSDPPAG